MGYSKIPVRILQTARNLDNTGKNHEKGFYEQMYKHYRKAVFKKT